MRSEFILYKKTFTALALLLTFCPAAHAEHPAGAALFFKSAGEVYLLLADHAGKVAHRGWATFGGKPHDGESPAQTAARETEEETRGFFLQSDLLRRIADRPPILANDGFASFFIEIPFVPVQRIENNRTPEDDPFYTERGPYAWIPFSEIEKYLQTEIDNEQNYAIDKRFLPAGNNSDWFWPVCLTSLRNAMKNGALPWHQPQQQKQQTAK